MDRGFPANPDEIVITEKQVPEISAYRVKLTLHNLNNVQAEYIKKIVDRGEDRCANCAFGTTLPITTRERFGCLRNAPSASGFIETGRNGICGDHDRDKL